MPNIDNLLAISFHAERVASKQLMKKTSCSEEVAFLSILSKVAGKKGIDQLIIHRQQHIKKYAEKKLNRPIFKKQQFLFKKQKKQAPSNAWCLWFDGSAQPNPGLCSIGVVLKSPDNRCWTVSRLIGHGDSSKAEYQALIAGLSLAIDVFKHKENNISPLTVIGDSQVVINDMLKTVLNASTILSSYKNEATHLLTLLPHVNFLWRPRHENQEADALTQSAFELHYSQN